MTFLCIFCLLLFLGPAFTFGTASTEIPAQRNLAAHPSPDYSTSLTQANYSSPLIQLGYGPTSLFPVSEQIPVYTVNDELWIESNYNVQIVAQLSDANGNTLVSSPVNPNSIVELYTFSATLSTSNLTLGIVNGTQQYSIPLQFVNPENSTLDPLTATYSVGNASLVAHFSAPQLDNKFDIQQCLTNSSSISEEALLSLPNGFGSGSLGVEQVPKNSDAMLFLQNANAISSFSFSFDLETNYTYELPQTSGAGYTSTQQIVASSGSVLVNPRATSFPTTLAILPLTYSAGLRNGRYTLRAFFQNENYSSEATTTLLFQTSSFAWYWLGSCQTLGRATAQSFSSVSSLSGSPNRWPRYLYLMYQVQPGIESYSEYTLNLNLVRTVFLVAGNNSTLPPDIQISWDAPGSSSSITGVDVENGGVAYLVANNSLPLTESFEFSFAGKNFTKEGATLNSPFSQNALHVALGQLDLKATANNGQPVQNATVNILSRNLSTSTSGRTDLNGSFDLYVPPGSYTVTVKSGSKLVILNTSVLAGQVELLSAVFPSPPDYTQSVLYLISILTVIGALGNFWFWFGKRYLRRLFRRQ